MLDRLRADGGPAPDAGPVVEDSPAVARATDEDTTLPVTDLISGQVNDDDPEFLDPPAP